MENRGVLKKFITTFDINDFEVGNLITQTLLEKGFEIVTKPLLNDMKMGIGETITVYRVK